MTASESPNVRRTMQMVRAMGLTCTRTAYGEYRVDYPAKDSRHTPDSAYHTDDAEDALGTARLMAGWRA